MLIFARLFYIQIIWGKELQAKAIDQWTREIPVVAQRGKIVDTNGVVLADNKDTYSIFVRKRAVKNMEKLCIKLCEQGAIIEEDGDVKIVPENCDDCDLCIQNCPNQAISKA